jgi:hypothetical protein
MTVLLFRFSWLNYTLACCPCDDLLNRFVVSVARFPELDERAAVRVLNLRHLTRLSSLLFAFASPAGMK